MAGQTKEKSVCNGEDMFTMQEIRDERKLTRIRNLPVDQIVDFPDHPYRVRDDQDMAYLVKSIRACGDCGGTTKERYLEILEFTHFVEFFSFNKIGENHKEKLLVQEVTVVVALDLDTGNTKNPEYESE